MTTDVHDLLDTFLAVAGADRTQRTRDRYAAVLDLLRAPLPREPSGSPVEPARGSGARGDRLARAARRVARGSARP
nr:hypothetical protein [Angustibacter aerolatus]